jgi:hypothetical protein
MITVLNGWKYIGVEDIFFQVRRDVDVIDSPAFVLQAHTGKALAPPTIASRFGMYLAKRIHPTVGEELVHPASLLGQESGRVLIAFGIVNVNFLVRYIVISAQDKFGMLGFQLFQILHEFREPLVLELLSLVARGARGEIGVDQPNSTEVQLHNTAFIVAHLMSGPVLYMIGFYFGKNGHPAVSFFLCREPIVLVP